MSKNYSIRFDLLWLNWSILILKIVEWIKIGTDRQYFHKWAMLTNPKDLSAGPKGYVKCNITINVKGEKMRVHPETEGEDDIEG